MLPELRHPVPVLLLTFTALIINVRHVLMSASLSRHIEAIPRALHPLVAYQGVVMPYMLTGEIEVAIVFGLATIGPAIVGSMNIGDVDLFIFHQANLRINEYVAKSLEIPEDKLFNSIEKYGNTSAASSLSFTLDSQVAAPLVSLATDSGSSATDHITN